VQAVLPEHVAVHAGARRGAHPQARTLASGIASLEKQDDATLDETFRRASALYKAAYQPRSRVQMDSYEALIRMALPWHTTPRLLARMKLTSATSASGAAVRADRFGAEP
jgi:hypothetical protein